MLPAPTIQRPGVLPAFEVGRERGAAGLQQQDVLRRRSRSARRRGRGRAPARHRAGPAGARRVSHQSAVGRAARPARRSTASSSTGLKSPARGNPTASTAIAGLQRRDALAAHFQGAGRVAQVDGAPVESSTTPRTCARWPTPIRQRELQERIDHRCRAREGVRRRRAARRVTSLRRGHQQLRADELPTGVEACRRDRGHADQAVDGDPGRHRRRRAARAGPPGFATRRPPGRRRRGRPGRGTPCGRRRAISTSWLSRRPETSCSSGAGVAAGSRPWPRTRQGSGRR